MDTVRRADGGRLRRRDRVKPVLFVTGHVPAYRAQALALLHAREGIEVALFGGPSLHGGPDRAGELPFPHREVRPSALLGLAASGRYRAVIVPSGGRLAPLAGWVGARAGRVPLILWASLWSHPRSFAHALSYLPAGRLYTRADAVVTYGPHVSAYVAARGARNVHVAPQAVDNDFWGAAVVSPPQVAGWPEEAAPRFLFVGRAAPEKGLDVLLRAWGAVRERLPGAALVLAGVGGGFSTPGPAAGVLALDPLPPTGLRDVYAASDVLVLPSVATATFLEPWGLVVNEAMNRGLAVIASDAVGAAAGGLVRDRTNGLIVPAGDAAGLAEAMAVLGEDRAMLERLADNGREDVRAYTEEAWAEGFSRALGTVGLARGHW